MARNLAQIPKADVDSRVMPNKEGGYAEFHAVGGDRRGGGDDRGLRRHRRPRRAKRNAVHGGSDRRNLRPEARENAGGHRAWDGLELGGHGRAWGGLLRSHDRGEPSEGNPAKRSDPRQAVAEEERAKLPRNDKQKLAKSCSVYDEENDGYYRPMGRRLDYKETNKDRRGGMAVSRRVYRCADCVGCVLAGECLDPKAKRGRTVQRDE